MQYAASSSRRLQSSFNQWEALRVQVFVQHSCQDGNKSQHIGGHPVRLVHSDYTVVSGPQRVQDVLPDEAETLLQKRFAFNLS